MEFLAGIIVYFLVGLIWGLITQHVSESKGYSTGFAWGFWLGFVGLIVVACKPTLQMSILQSSSSEKEKLAAATFPEIKPIWTCKCGTQNSQSLNYYCTRCRRSRDEIPKTICPHCNAYNSKYNKKCFSCNRTLIDAADSSSDASPTPLPPIPTLKGTAFLPSIDSAEPDASPASSTRKSAAKESQKDNIGASNKLVDPYEMIEKLHSLYDRGILTEEEFAQKKAQFLEMI